MSIDVVVTFVNGTGALIAIITTKVSIIWPGKAQIRLQRIVRRAQGQRQVFVVEQNTANVSPALDARPPRSPETTQ